MADSYFPSKKMFLLTAAAVSATAVGLIYLWRRRRSHHKACCGPHYVGYVSAINMYPVKSCQAVPVDEVNVINMYLEANGIRDRYVTIALIIRDR